MAGSNRIADIALFYLRSHARGRACTHNVNDDDRDFCDGCHGNGFSHEGKPWAGSSGESTNAGITCAHSHHAGGQFVFRLYDRTVDLVYDFDHVFHDFRSRGNRVRCHEAGTCGNSTEGCCFIAKQVQLIFLRRSCQSPQRYALQLLDSYIIAVLENLFVLGNDFFALLAEAFSDETIERVFRESQNACAHAQCSDVLHLHAAVLSCQLRDWKRQENTSGMCVKFRVECVISDDNAALRNFMTVKVDSLLVQGYQAVYMLTDRSDFFRCDTQGNRCMTALNAGCEETLAEKGIPFLCQYASENFAAGFYALTLLSAHFPNKITFRFHSICLLADECKGNKYNMGSFICGFPYYARHLSI